MWVRTGGERKTDGEVDAMPVFEPYLLSEGNISPNILEDWADKVRIGNKFHFSFKRSKVPFYGLQSGQSKGFQRKGNPK